MIKKCSKNWLGRYLPSYKVERVMNKKNNEFYRYIQLWFGSNG